MDDDDDGGKGKKKRGQVLDSKRRWANLHWRFPEPCNLTAQQEKTSARHASGAGHGSIEPPSQQNAAICAIVRYVSSAAAILVVPSNQAAVWKHRQQETKQEGTSLGERETERARERARERESERGRKMKKAFAFFSSVLQGFFFLLVP
jgi:hypothetical protein